MFITLNVFLLSTHTDLCRHRLENKFDGGGGGGGGGLFVAHTYDPR